MAAVTSLVCDSVTRMLIGCPQMRHVVTAIVLAAILAATAGCRPADRGPATPENFLLITLDTLRPDHLGCYGYGRNTSPALDRFAASSTLFLDVTCSMPTTLPSHVTIFTGLPPSVHGLTRNGMVPGRDLLTVFDLFAERGSRTAAIVSAGVLQDRFLAGLGFEEVIFDRPRPEVFQIPADVVSDNALRWLDRYADQSFALWLHYFETHEPYTPPAEFARTFSDGYGGALSDRLETDWLVSLNEPDVVADLSDADRQHVVDLYDAEIAFLDQQLARVFRELETRGLLESTMVVIIGDHGQAHGEAGFWGHGERLLEPVIKVPMMMRLPGQQAGRSVVARVETLDVAPTVVEVFNFSEMEQRPGRSLVDALLGGGIEAAERRTVVRRDYAAELERRGLVVHLGETKGTYYREPLGQTFHIGRVDGDGGLDGENFYSPESPTSQWFKADVRRFLEMDAETGSAVSIQDLEMLRALGYTQ